MTFEWSFRAYLYTCPLINVLSILVHLRSTGTKKGINAKPKLVLAMVSEALGEMTTILLPKATHNRGLFTVTPCYSV
jgi:hypothetical protein